MSEKKIEMNVKRGTTYDILHPITEASVVEYTKNGVTSNVETVLTTTSTNMENVVATAHNIEIRQHGLFIIAKDTLVPTSAWVSDLTYEDYPYRASIIVDGCNENYCPDVYFDVEDIKLGIFAPIAETDLRTVYIYASEIPANNITIPTIKLATEADKISLVKVLALINVDKLPTKTEYEEGEAISYSGMKVSAIYSDGSAEEITNYSTSPSAGTVLSEGEYTVSINYTDSGVTKTTSFAITVKKSGPDIKYFASNTDDPERGSTDAEFLAMVQALQDGTITTGGLPWRVGDTRTVNLSAFTSYPSGSASTQAAQTAQLVILHVGNAGKEFTDGSTPSYIIGFKENVAKSYYHGSNNVYDSSLLKTVEDNIYNALPSSIKSAFKQFKAITGVYSGSTYATYNRYMCSPAGREVFGTESSSGTSYGGGYSIYAEHQALGENAQFDYYKTTNNRKHSNLSIYWWERSPVYNFSDSACIVFSDGTAINSDVNIDYGVAPFGCI